MICMLKCSFNTEKNIVALLFKPYTFLVNSSILRLQYESGSKHTTIIVSFSQASRTVKLKRLTPPYSKRLQKFLG